MSPRRSPIAHARIARIDVTAAAAAPGVLGVYRNSDLGVGPYPNPLPAFPAEMVHPLLADRVVRFVGEAVVAIVAENRYCAADAADLVEVDYEPLPPLVDPEASTGSAVILHPDVPHGNVVFRTATAASADSRVARLFSTGASSTSGFRVPP